MIINIVALEMLGDRMPKLGSGLASFSLLLFCNLKNIWNTGGGRKESKAVGGSSDEDPYSLTGLQSSKSYSLTGLKSLLTDRFS